MKIETETRITETVCSREATLMVRHDDSYFSEFRFSCGCVDEWMTEDEVKTLVRLLNAGLRKLRAVNK